ncbi:MAG TPA: Rpn family recombination-promoting nuclease/putative transposase [Thermoanaerobaculia bacterium]|nr:Rpn family recombination-promoting nuclease/putative transposase [Thermoanaerobaculia bacterium]
MAARHDHGYKRLFSHPEMVADLLRGFVQEDWVRDLDFSTLERVPNTFVTRKLRSRRESDVVWRVRWGRDRWLYVYLILEFQSTVDPFMALRLMVYLGLFYQDLIQRHQLTPEGKLPPVLPLVLYNGHPPWGAARDVADLIAGIPGGLERYRPQLRYCLLDEERMADSELESLRNVAAALFRLEKSHGPQDIERILTALLDWLQEPELAELKRSFAEWMVEVLLPGRVPGVTIPQVADLQEVRSMLAERVIEWTQQWKQEGLEEGLEQGREEGLEQARERTRGVLLRDLERRFGLLPADVRRQIDEIGSIEELIELSLRVGGASSIGDLGLG